MSKKDINDFKLYQIPIDALSLNIMVYRKEGNDFIIVDFNKVAQITENIDSKSIIGQILTDVFPSVKESGLYEVLERIDKEGGHETFDSKFYEDGSISGWRKNEIIKLPNGDVVVMYENLIKEKKLEEEKSSIERKLIQSEEQFRTIAENSLMGIFIYIDSFVYVNQALCEMSGFTNEELLNIKPWELAEESMQKPMKNRMSRRLSGEHFSHKYDDMIMTCKSGEKKIARIMTETIKYKDGYAGLGSLIDITDIKNTKQKLKMLAQAVEQTDELVMITDADGRVTYVNDAYVAHSGYKHNELIGKNLNIFKSGVHSKDFFKELWKTILNGKIYSKTIKNRKKDGQFYYEELTISPIYDDEGVIQNYISTGRDITPRIKMEEELKRRATTDELTKIYNRYHGNEILDIEIDRVERYKSSFALLMFDIDKFKLVNDTYGHDIGDIVLEQLSQIISTHLRKSDTFVRWGGEEFLIISVHLEKEEAMKFAQKLRVAVESYEFDTDLKVTISVGVTLSKIDDTKGKVLKRVDNALYEAKEDGRNCIKFL